MNINKFLNYSKFELKKVINQYKYKELIQLTNYYQDKLKTCEKNERIMIKSDKSLDFVAIMMATWNKNCIFIPVSDLKKEYINICKPNILIENNEIKEKSNYKIKVNQNISSIFFTSGTTNQPKGVVLTHENIIQNLKMIDSYFNHQITSFDKSFSILPWCHIYGFVCELLFMMSKGGNIILPSLQNPKEVINEIKEHDPTLLFLVPKILNEIKKKDNPFIPFWIKKKYLFGNKIKMISVGGSHCPIDTIKFIKSKYNIEVYQGYGMTECGPMIALNSPFQNKVGSVGKPFEAIQLEINKENEIIIHSSPSLMIGYLNSIENNKMNISFLNKNFKTGDKGVLDQDGYLYINGRIKNEIKLSNGKYVNPEYIENLILKSKWIHQTIIFPSQDNSYLICLFNCYEKKKKEVVIEEIKKLLNDIEYYEKPKLFYYLNQPLSIENGLLSNKLEMKRNIIQKNFVEQKLDIL